MKKKYSFFMLLASFALMFSCTDKNMSRNADGSYTVNTIELGKKIKGYAGPIPLNITIKDSVIQGVVLLSNIETPEYMIDVENRMIPKYKGLSISKIADVDAVSGATFSSRAIIRNVDLAVKYYFENR